MSKKRIFVNKEERTADSMTGAMGAGTIQNTGESKSHKSRFHFICAILLVAFAGLNTFDAMAQTFSGGNGTSGNPYQISTPADLVELSNYVNSDMSTSMLTIMEKNTYNKYFIVTQNIDMQGIHFIPIGRGMVGAYYRYFCGNFDGQGHAVKNLFIDTSITSMSYVGLFGVVGGATISNLTLDKAFFVRNSSYIGGMVGAAGGGFAWYLNNCKVINTTFKYGSGMVGNASGGTINNCHVIDVTIANVSYGFVKEVDNSRITNSSVAYSTLTTPSRMQGTFEIGDDLNGFAKLDNANSSISSCCVANCNISGAGNTAGFGRVTKGTMYDCYTQSKLSRTLNDNKYSFAGFAYEIGDYWEEDTARILRCYTTNDFASPHPSKEIAWGYGLYNGSEKVTNCFYNADHPTAGGTVTHSTGVTGKTTAYMTSQNMVDDLNSGITPAAWKADFAVNPINKGYPLLSWQQHLLYLSTYVSNVSYASATLEGYAFTDAEPFIEYGFEWREKGTPTWAVITATLGGKDFSSPITGLRSNTEYECKVYAKTASATLYGDTLVFKTLLRLAAVTTMPAVNMTDSTAILKGLTASNDEAILEQGFEWREYGAASWNVNTVLLNIGSISLPLTNLTKHEAYEFRAYIVTNNAKRYGKILAFTAADPYDTTLTIEKIAEVSTLPATNITDKSATIHGIVVANDENILSQGFEWRILYSGDNWTVSPVATGSSIISFPLSRLPNRTPYEFRAYAQTPDAVRYGVILTFTTTEEDETGIVETHRNASLQVYPNPTKNELRITGYEFKDNAQYNIYSIVGQVVQQGTLQGESTTINVKSLAAGMYYLKVDNKTVRFLKE